MPLSSTGRAQGNDGGARRRVAGAGHSVPVAPRGAHPTLRWGPVGLPCGPCSGGSPPGLLAGCRRRPVRRPDPQAVWALQKVAGLERDGVCGPATWSEVDAGRRPKARSTKGTSSRSTSRPRRCWSRTTASWRGSLNTSTGSGRTAGRQGARRRHAVRGLPGLPPGRRLGRRPAGQAVPAAVLQRRHRRPRLPLGRRRRRASHGCCRVSLPAVDFLLGRRRDEGRDPRPGAVTSVPAPRWRSPA